MVRSICASPINSYTRLISVKKVIDNLLSTQNSSTKQLFGPLEKLREVISSRSLLRIVKCYDEVASTIIEHKEDFASLVGAIRQEEIVDQFWSFFLHDVPENQLARPDDYSYARLFVHSPFWVSLLLSKIGMPPPSIQVLFVFCQVSLVWSS